MDLFRWIATKFGARYVELVDHDGDISVRRMWHRNGLWYASRHGWGIRQCRLADGGEVPNGCYVVGWRPYFPFSGGQAPPLPKPSAGGQP